MPEPARPPLRRVAVLIPTYNERDSLPVVVRQVRELDMTEVHAQVAAQQNSEG